MEKKITGLSALAFGFVIFILSSCHSEAITCPEALMLVLPCKPFLEGAHSDSPGQLCCLGVQKLTQEASTTETRRAVCQCLKNALQGLHINPDRAKQIPQLCHINDPIPIDPNVDCSTLPWSYKRF